MQATFELVPSVRFPSFLGSTVAPQSSNRQQPQERAYTVTGYFPSGESYSDTVVALSPIDARIRVIASLRYEEDGGDLSVSRVMDASTGKVVEDGPLDLPSESEALETLVFQLRGSIPSLASSGETGTLNAYLELFELLLSDAPHALDGIAAGEEGYAEEDLMMQFIDSSGADHTIVPAVALAALVQKSQELAWSPAAAQLAELAARARVAVSLSIIDALCEV